jgi:hypothetical protein
MKKVELLMSRLLKAFMLWVPPIVWGIVIFSFSSSQIPPVSETHWQEFLIKKTAHVIEYSIFAVFIFRALRGSGVLSRRAFFISVLICVIYALTDEFHQSFTPGREPTLRDVTIDSLASFFSLSMVVKFLPKSSGKIKEIANDLNII